MISVFQEYFYKVAQKYLPTLTIVITGCKYTGVGKTDEYLYCIPIHQYMNISWSNFLVTIATGYLHGYQGNRITPKLFEIYGLVSRIAMAIECLYGYQDNRVNCMVFIETWYCHHYSHDNANPWLKGNKVSLWLP